MRLAIIGAVLLAAGAVAAVTGTLPAADLAALVDRVAPILLFVVAMTVVTELASEAGIFLWIARRFRHWGRGYSFLLWLFLAVFATLSTIFLSLDTTAVLLTPVVVSVTRQAGLPPLPFALMTVWLANTASLLLPISNLTNLLAQHSLGGISPAGFAALMWAPSLAAVLVPLVFIALVFRRDLSKRYSRIPVGRVRPDAETGKPDGGTTDRVLLGGTAVVLALLLPALVSGVPVWIPAVAAAAGAGRGLRVPPAPGPEGAAGAVVPAAVRLRTLPGDGNRPAPGRLGIRGPARRARARASRSCFGWPRRAPSVPMC